MHRYAVARPLKWTILSCEAFDASDAGDARTLPLNSSSRPIEGPSQFDAASEDPVINAKRSSSKEVQHALLKHTGEIRWTETEHWRFYLVRLQSFVLD